MCGDYRQANKAVKRERHPIPTPSKVFQNAIQRAIQGLDGVKNIADDIIVWGNTQQQHDQRVEQLFARLQEKNPYRQP